MPTVDPRRLARSNAEQWIYDRSPFGIFVTSLLLLALFLASFAAAQLIDRVPFLDRQGRVAGLTDSVWPAIVLSVMLTVILGVQRYARTRDNADAPAYARVFQRSGPQPDFLTPAVRRNLRIATLVGLIAGAGLTGVSVPQAFLWKHPLIMLWFFAVESLVSILFARGVVMSARSNELFSRLIRDDLQIDLLRIDLLAVIGRNGARTALIWFGVAAVICLFFVGDNMAISTFATMLGAAGMGLWIFLQPVMQVHRRIRAAKQAELEKLRHSISDLCAKAPGDTDAAARLHGLLAYETRIEAVREWPFDQTTALRLSAYLLIPAIPWFGQAIAQYFVERLAHTG